VTPLLSCFAMTALSLTLGASGLSTTAPQCTASSWYISISTSASVTWSKWPVITIWLRMGLRLYEARW
jgi:hypothetical protein